MIFMKLGEIHEGANSSSNILRRGALFEAVSFCHPAAAEAPEGNSSPLSILHSEDE
jgi:hypothetical protein